MDFKLIASGTCQARPGTDEERSERLQKIYLRAFGTTDFDEIWRQVTETVAREMQ